MKGRVWVSERVHGPAEVNQMSPPDSPGDLTPLARC